MAITAPIAGAYTGVHNSNALNYTRQGYNLNFVQKGERIEETDLYGLSLIEIIGRGSQMTIDTICKIYSSSTYGALWPWGTFTAGGVYAAATPISRLASSVAASLVLTAVANTPAAATPATMTASKSIISPDQNLQLIFNSVHREVPLRFDVLLTDTTGTGSLFTMT